MEAGHPELREILESEEEIEAILGKPAPRMITKVIVTEGVGPAISRPLRDGNGFAIQHVHKARRIALWGSVDAPGRIARGDDYKRRPGNKS